MGILSIVYIVLLAILLHQLLFQSSICFLYVLIHGILFLNFFESRRLVADPGGSSSGHLIRYIYPQLTLFSFRVCHCSFDFYSFVNHLPISISSFDFLQQATSAQSLSQLLPEGFYYIPWLVNCNMPHLVETSCTQRRDKR